MSTGARAPLGAARAAEILLAQGITPTQQRLEIARNLLGREQHVSAEDLLARVNAGGVRVSKATVYNTLKLLAERGLVREVIVDPSRVFYDSNTRPHHHFYDVSTGTLMDIGEDEVEFRRLPEPPEGAEMEGVEVIVRVRSHIE